MGWGPLEMGIPTGWHRRQALMIASQLPETMSDAELIVQAVTELLETFLARAPIVVEVEGRSNVLPFS